MWVQDFAGPAGLPPDAAIWTHEVGGGGWGDRQRQIYTDDTGNAALDGAGHLAITARRESDGVTITSARLDDERSLCREVRQGRGVQQDARRLRDLAGVLDAGHRHRSGGLAGLRRDRCDGARGRGPYPLLWNDSWPRLQRAPGGIGGAVDAGIDLSEDFHRYAVAWEESGVAWILDGREHHRITPSDVPGPWPFDHDFYLLVNLAIGGDWSGNDTEPELPTSLLIDWIRVDEVG